MKFKYLLTLLSCAVLSNATFAQERISKDVAAAMELASADQMKADITYLADDKLMGRKPGTPGYKMAADYVIEQLKKNGVKPAGDNGTWLQSLLMRSASLDPNFTATLSSKNSNDVLASVKDITISANPVSKTSNVNAEIVFVGYGIKDASKNRDDYKGIDVKGKIVLIVRGAPSSFSQADATAISSVANIQKTAIENGAIGVITATTVDRPNNNPNAVTMASRPSTSVMTPKGELVISSGFTSDKLQIVGSLSFGMVNKIFTAANKSLTEVLESLKNGNIQSFATGFTLKANYKTNHSDFTTFNVAGKIEGSDPKLKNEYVVHSAHLDHMGIGRPVEGDSIYNGAHDNASGVASLLQITKAYSGLKAKPKRSILILMVSAEEMGLLGSAYFALKPTVNINQVVANVNTDMPAIIAPLLSVTALGADHSSLVNPVNEASAYLGLTVEPDPEPNENRFVRSDQYSFIKEGIPALHIKYGNKTPDGKNNLDVFVKEWRAKYYHKPQDDINGIFDFNAGRKYAQLNFLIGYLIANDVERPKWNPGDIFEKKK